MAIALQLRNGPLYYSYSLNLFFPSARVCRTRRSLSSPTKRAAAMRAALYCSILLASTGFSAALRSTVKGKGTATVVSAWEAPLLKAVSLPYFAYPAAIVQSRPIIESVFGQPSTTFEDNLREPAAGFLALYSPLGVLEGSLCLALAGAVALSPEDRSRVGATLAVTSFATLAALFFALATGMEVLNAPALAAVVAITATTGALGFRAVDAVDDPVAVYQADAAELLPFATQEEPSATEITSLFYRSSTLVGVLVGLSFLMSPLSPIALFDTPESPTTHLMRQQLGIYIVFLLAPVQAALFRAAKDGTLADATTRATNIVTGLCCCLLVCDGRVQTNAGAEAFAKLQPGTEFYDLVTAALGDPAAVGRAQTNTDAAFTVGFVVSCFYFYQAALAGREEA